MSNPRIAFHDILALNFGVTGIRQQGGEGHPVLITGSAPPAEGGQPQGALYTGPLYPTDGSGYVTIVPFAGQVEVTTSVFYGPNTSLFDPSLGEGNIRIVGSYKYAGGNNGGKGNVGCMYTGPLDGSGEWIQINVPSDLAGGQVSNCILHSTMGDLLVGNYDLVDDPGSGYAFIYNIKTCAYTIPNLGPLATLYGVWQNGIGSDSYTLTGGVQSGNKINSGLLFDYNASTGTITNQTALTFDGDVHNITHFEGITGVPNGFNLVGMFEGPSGTRLQPGVFLANVPRNADGSFGSVQWIGFHDSEAGPITTGNSILENNVIGLYPTTGGIQSYLAVVTP